MADAGEVLVVADSDSYLKWAAARVGDLRAAGFRVRCILVASAVTPSIAQVEAAVHGHQIDVESASWIGLRRMFASAAPDAVVLACRGPLLALIVREAIPDHRLRPVIVAGIPGIWMPPTAKGLKYRRVADLVIVHSRREAAAVRAELPVGRLDRVGLASLLGEVRGTGRESGGRVVFAPQALVPRAKGDRVRVLETLALAADRHPETEFVVKLRGAVGEAQTHAERWPYSVLAEERASPLPRNLVFRQGALATYLHGARGFATVSSTAALEAHAAGVPVLCLIDFGVGVENLNEVFDRSGFLGTLDQLKDLEFPKAREQWLADNYFHGMAENDWIDQLREALRVRRDNGLAAAPRDSHGPIRTIWRLQERAGALGDADSAWRRAHARVLRPVAVAARRVAHSLRRVKSRDSAR